LQPGRDVLFPADGSAAVRGRNAEPEAPLAPDEGADAGAQAAPGSPRGDGGRAGADDGEGRRGPLPDAGGSGDGPRPLDAVAAAPRTSTCAGRRRLVPPLLRRPKRHGAGALRFAPQNPAPRPAVPEESALPRRGAPGRSPDGRRRLSGDLVQPGCPQTVALSP